MLLPITRLGGVARMRALHRRMSFEAFERTVPCRPGWKREYYGGMAHVRPSWSMAFYLLAVAQRPPRPTSGLRPLLERDRDRLIDAFLDAFRFAPEYCDYSMALYRKQGAKYVEDFFGDKRGRWSAASQVVVRGGRVVAAALVKEADGKPPLLDCVMVRPSHFRKGLATAATAAAVEALAAAGVKELRSCAMLANEPSLAWHVAFGFRELPDLFVAQSRTFQARYELQRLEKIGRLTDEERKRLTEQSDYWWDEWQRLEKLPLERRDWFS